MKTISDVQFYEALKRIKDETAPAGYAEERIDIRDESDMHEQLGDILNDMDYGTARVIHIVDCGLVFGNESRGAIARICKAHCEQVMGLGLVAEEFASIVIEARGDIYHIFGVKILDEEKGEWRGWSFCGLHGRRILREHEVNDKISQNAVPAGFVQKTIVVQNKLTLQTELAEYIASYMHDEVIQNGGTERVVLIEDESAVLFGGGRYAIATIHASQFDDAVAQFAYYATIDFVSMGKKYSMTIRFAHDPASNGYVMTYGELRSADVGMQMVFDTGAISEQEFIALKSKIVSVTILGGAETYTTTIAWDSLGLSADAAGNTLPDQIWLPFSGVRLLVEKATEQAKVKIDTTGGGSASIVHLCGFN